MRSDCESVNLIDLQEQLKSRLRDTARGLFDVELAQIAAEVPPRTDLGDLAFPIAFELAKQIKQKTGEKKNPRAIAEAIKSKLEAFDAVDRVEVAGAGYLNVFFDRTRLLTEFSMAASVPLPAGGVGSSPSPTSPPTPPLGAGGGEGTHGPKLRRG